MLQKISTIFVCLKWLLFFLKFFSFFEILISLRPKKYLKMSIKDEH